MKQTICVDRETYEAILASGVSLEDFDIHVANKLEMAEFERENEMRSFASMAAMIGNIKALMEFAIPDMPPVPFTGYSNKPHNHRYRGGSRIVPHSEPENNARRKAIKAAGGIRQFKKKEKAGRMMAKIARNFDAINGPL